MKIILVCIGNFQEYILDNIKNLLLFGNKEIIVITDKKFFLNFIGLNITLMDCSKLDDLNFNSNSNIDKSFRNGFWHLCSQRLFYLYSFIKKYNMLNVIHIENDVMCYENLNNLENKFKSASKNKVLATFDCATRVIPGIIFIPHYQSFKPIIDNYSYNLNDMENLAKFDENIIRPLPIFVISKEENQELNKVTKLFDIFECIFDAAAMGQYLGGIDPRNDSNDTRGFINETCIIKYNGYKFCWIKDLLSNLYKPYLIVNNKLIPIINLHIHSKDLKAFNGLDPINNKFIIKEYDFTISNILT